MTSSSSWHAWKHCEKPAKPGSNPPGPNAPHPSAPVQRIFAIPASHGSPLRSRQTRGCSTGLHAAQRYFVKAPNYTPCCSGRVDRTLRGHRFSGGRRLSFSCDQTRRDCSCRPLRMTGHPKAALPHPDHYESTQLWGGSEIGSRRSLSNLSARSQRANLCRSRLHPIGVIQSTPLTSV